MRNRALKRGYIGLGGIVLVLKRCHRIGWVFLRMYTQGATCMQRWMWCSYRKTSKKGISPIVAVCVYIEKAVKHVKNGKFVGKRYVFQPLQLSYVFRVQYSQHR